MVGINKGPITLDLKTVFERKAVGVQPRPLGQGAIVGVIIQNSLNNIDATNSGNNIDVMIGDETAQLYQMLPGQESPIIYAEDLSDIYARVRTGIVEVELSLIIYKQKD